MATFKRVVPLGQRAITQHELEQAGATEIEWSFAGDGHVEVTATLPDGRPPPRPLRVIMRLRKNTRPPGRGSAA